jgi:AraC-like DNA-binding protein/ligand-binding sensor protein
MAKHLIESLAGSKMYQDYERAFGETMGLPIALRSVESRMLPHHGRPFENPFCALLAQAHHTCAACLQVQQRLREKATLKPQTITCQAGLCETAVPLRIGDQLIGYLTTGQMFRKLPTEAQFNHTAKLLADWGVHMNRKDLHTLYFKTRVLTARQHESIVRLLAIFADHLSILSNRIVVQGQNVETPAILRAKHYISEHLAEPLSLGQVARSVNESRFYFCKQFKKATGLSFTDYVSRVRTERAVNLLINPKLRVSEAAFESGFQSVTHFNRVFKRILGRTPTGYREQLVRA